MAAYLTLEDLRASPVFKNLLPEQQAKLERKFIEQFGVDDPVNSALASTPNEYGPLAGVPEYDALLAQKEHTEKQREPVPPLQDIVVPEYGWKDPVSWVAGLGGGILGGLGRMAGPGMLSTGASTLGDIVASETVAEVGANMAEAIAENAGFPTLAPAVQAALHGGTHAVASQMYRAAPMATRYGLNSIKTKLNEAKETIESAVNNINTNMPKADQYKTVREIGKRLDEIGKAITQNFTTGNLKGYKDKAGDIASNIKGAVNEGIGKIDIDKVTEKANSTISTKTKHVMDGLVNLSNKANTLPVNDVKNRFKKLARYAKDIVDTDLNEQISRLAKDLHGIDTKEFLNRLNIIVAKIKTPNIGDIKAKATDLAGDVKTTATDLAGKMAGTAEDMAASMTAKGSDSYKKLVDELKSLGVEARMLGRRLATEVPKGTDEYKKLVSHAYGKYKQILEKLGLKSDINIKADDSGGVDKPKVDKADVSAETPPPPPPKPPGEPFPDDGELDNVMKYTGIDPDEPIVRYFPKDASEVEQKAEEMLKARSQLWGKTGYNEAENMIAEDLRPDRKPGSPVMERVADLMWSWGEALHNARYGKPIGEKLKSGAQWAHDKSMSDIVGAFTKYEYNKPAKLVTVRDMLNKTSSRLVGDTAIRIKKIRNAINTGKTDHFYVEKLFTTPMSELHTLDDLPIPSDIKQEVLALRKTIADLGEERYLHGLLKRNPKLEPDNAGYLPRLYRAFEHPDTFDAQAAREKYFNGAVYAMAKKFANGAKVTPDHIESAREYLNKLLRYVELKQAKGSGTYNKEMMNLERSLGRTDLPQEVRLLLGEIQDPLYRAYRAIKDQAFDIQHNLMLSYVAKEVPDVVTHENLHKAFAITKQQYKSLPEDLKNKFTKLSMKDDLKKFPMHRWGGLEGMYVRNDVYNELVGSIKQMNKWQEAYSEVLSIWKKMKVPLSPRTVMRNLFSDSIMKWLGGMPMTKQKHYLSMAKNALKNAGPNHPLVKEAMDYGVLDSGLFTSDSRMFMDTLDKAMLTPDNIDKSPAKFIRRFHKWIDSAGASAMGGLGIGDRASQVYSHWENMSKMSMYMFLRDPNGLNLPAPKAAELTKLYLFDYSALPPALKALSQSTHPFIGYPYLATRAMVYTMKNAPHRIFGMLLAAQIAKGTADMLGYDVNVEDLLPYSHMWQGIGEEDEDTSMIGNALSPLEPSGPSVLPLELLVSKDLHNNIPTPGIGGRISHAYQAMVPSILGYHGKKLIDPPENTPYLLTLLDALMGIKVKEDKD